MKFKNTKEQYARRKFIAEAAEIVPQENLRTHTANVQQQQTRNRHLTVIYNPVSGKKKAKNIIDKLVIPMFKASHTDYKIIPTEFSGHGIKLMEELDITQTDGVLVAGGDGMVQECVTGAMRLPQPPAMGIIPCGSGNAMANDLDQFISETESELIGRVVLAAIENKKQPVDVIGCFPLEPAIVEAFQSSSCVSSRSSEFSSGHNQDADSAAGAVAVTAAAAAAANFNDKTNNNNNNANDNNHNSNNSNLKSKLVPAPIFSTTNNTKMVNYNRNLELNRLNDLSSPCSSPCDSLSSSSDSSSSLKNKVNTMADQQTVFGSPCSSTTDTLSQSTQSLDQLLLHGPTNNAALNGNITAQTTTITTTKAATAAAAAAAATATATITAITSNTNNNTTNNTAATLTATLTATTEDENIIPGYYSSSMSDTDSETEADIQETIKVNSAPATGVSNAYATTNTTTSITNKSIYDSKNNDDKKDDKNIYNYKNKAQNTFQQQQQQQQQQQLQPQQQPQQQQHLSPSVTLNLNEKNDTVTIEESQEARKNAFFGLSVFGYGIGGAITKAAESLRWLPGRKTLRYDIAGLKTFATEWPIHCPVRISLPKDAREHFYSTNTKQQHGQAALTAEGDLLQHGWITRSTQLVNLIATKLPVLAQGNPVAPGVSRADGRIALTMIEGPQGRFAMMRSGFNMKRGKYLASDKSSTTVYVKEFIITPLDPDSTIEYLIDGDSKPAEPLHVKIFHHALTLFANPRYNDNWV